MPEAHHPSTLAPSDDNRLGWVSLLLSIFGFASYAMIIFAVHRNQFNIVNYTVVNVNNDGYGPAMYFAIMLLLVSVWLGVRVISRTSIIDRRRVGSSLFLPLILCAPLSFYTFLPEAVPPFFLTLLAIMGIGGFVYLIGLHIDLPRLPRWGNVAAVVSIVLMIAMLTLIHTRIQINFYEHFMLGHADFGHFTEELKNALAGRGLRCDSFENTRLGWHFVPLLYLLVPGYALWPSPYYLMAVGGLFVHLAALPAYFFARRLSGSTLVGWMFAVAWLLLPSNSRLIYSNTYGFQWIYVAIPIIAVMIATGVIGCWKTSLVMVLLILLTKETAAAATFGWGVYMFFFAGKRKTGLLVVITSTLYFILCVKVLIPHFSVSGQYERLDLFGTLGQSFTDLMGSLYTQPTLFFSRFVRKEGLYFISIMLVPMMLWPIRGWRISIASLPSLVMILLLQNNDWLSIKFWHHATVLPVLFFAGIAAMQHYQGDDPPTPPWFRGFSGGKKGGRRGGLRFKSTYVHSGMALAALFCAAWGHYFYGFSPLSKSFEMYADSEFLQTPDPRLEVVQHLRNEIPRERTILASERLAAHFTDYKRLYTGKRTTPVDFIIIDRGDRWDQSGLVQQIHTLANDPQYQRHSEHGSIIVFQRSPHAPPVAPF